MIAVTKKLKELPRRTYVPESLKAAIDLEIDELLERKLMLEPVPGEGRFELRPMYRPAPPPPPVFTLRPEPEPEPEEAPDETPQEQTSAEIEEVKTDTEPELEEIAEIQPGKLYQVLEPEPETEDKPEPEAEPIFQPEPIPRPELKPLHEQLPEPEPMPQPEPELIPEQKPDPEPPRPRRGRPKGSKSVKVVFEPEPVQVQRDPDEPQPETDTEEPSTEQIRENDARRETEEENKAASASKMEVKHIAAPIAEIAMLTDSSYGRKPRKDRRSAPMDVPPTAEERMQLLQKFASDKRRSVRRHQGQNVDILCQSVHTALSAALRDERSHDEEEKWAKLLFRIRGGVMTRRYSTEYLYRFLDATIEMYALDVE